MNLQQELPEAYADPVYFLKLFLPHWFPDSIPWFHRGIIAIFTRKTDFLLKYGEVDKIVEHFVWQEDPWDDASPKHKIFKWDGEKLLLIIARHTLLLIPRGFAKTTLMNGLELYDILFQNTDFDIYISESSTHAQMQLRNVQRELESNDVILNAFGTLKPTLSDPQRWTNDYFETLSERALMARGRGSQIRGQNRRGKRPSKIVLDDVEDREAVATDEQREKTRQWFYRDVLPALGRRDASASIFALGTLLNSDSLLVTLSRDPRFNTIRFGATLANGEALWPEHMPLSTIEIEKNAAARAGDLNGFYMEYFNQVRNVDGAKFKQQNFIYGPTPGDVVKAITIDPAISNAPGASHCTIAVVGMDLKSGKIHLIDLWGKRGAAFREQCDMYFDMAKRHECNLHGVEAIAYQSALVHLLREEMFRKKYYFEISEIRHKTKKEQRIEGILQPRYANQYIVHERRFPALETALLDWPNGQMDYPDVVAMAISLLDPYAAAAADPEFDLGKDEYEPMKIEYSV